MMFHFENKCLKDHIFSEIEGEKNKTFSNLSNQQAFKTSIENELDASIFEHLSRNSISSKSSESSLSSYNITNVNSSITISSITSNIISINSSDIINKSINIINLNKLKENNYFSNSLILDNLNNDNDFNINNSIITNKLNNKSIELNSIGSNNKIYSDHTRECTTRKRSFSYEGKEFLRTNKLIKILDIVNLQSNSEIITKLKSNNQNCNQVHITKGKSEIEDNCKSCSNYINQSSDSDIFKSNLENRKSMNSTNINKYIPLIGNSGCCEKINKYLPNCKFKRNYNDSRKENFDDGRNEKDNDDYLYKDDILVNTHNEYTNGDLNTAHQCHEYLINNRNDINIKTNIVSNNELVNKNIFNNNNEVTGIDCKCSHFYNEMNTDNSNIHQKYNFGSFRNNNSGAKKKNIYNNNIYKINNSNIIVKHNKLLIDENDNTIKNNDIHVSIIENNNYKTIKNNQKYNLKLNNNFIYNVNTNNNYDEKSNKVIFNDSIEHIAYKSKDFRNNIQVKCKDKESYNQVKIDKFDINSDNTCYEKLDYQNKIKDISKDSELSLNEVNNIVEDKTGDCQYVIQDMHKENKNNQHTENDDQEYLIDQLEEEKFDVTHICNVQKNIEVQNERIDDQEMSERKIEIKKILENCLAFHDE